MLGLTLPWKPCWVSVETMSGLTFVTVETVLGLTFVRLRKEDLGVSVIITVIIIIIISKMASHIDSREDLLPDSVVCRVFRTNGCISVVKKSWSDCLKSFYWSFSC